MASNHPLEEGSQLQLDFYKINRIADGGEPVIPGVAQDIDTGAVLLVGYVNRAALDYALKHRVATFWSTSRQALWIKGATSGDFLDLEETRVNCEQNAILYRVRLRGKGACHTRNPDGSSRMSCYYRRITPEGTLEMLKPGSSDNR
jgi:phosphoribosyl-AMP cyclohydrolase